MNEPTPISTQKEKAASPAEQSPRPSPEIARENYLQAYHAARQELNETPFETDRVMTYKDKSGREVKAPYASLERTSARVNEAFARHGLTVEDSWTTRDTGLYSTDKQTENQVRDGKEVTIVTEKQNPVLISQHHLRIRHVDGHSETRVYEQPLPTACLYSDQAQGKHHTYTRRYTLYSLGNEVALASGEDPDHTGRARATTGTEAGAARPAEPMSKELLQRFQSASEALLAGRGIDLPPPASREARNEVLTALWDQELGAMGLNITWSADVVPLREGNPDLYQARIQDLAEHLELTAAAVP